jgi:capsular exopolysaccharide synthesis family protein
MNTAVDLNSRGQSQGNAADEEVIDIRLYWEIVNRNKWGIFGLVFVVCVLAVVVVYALTPVFSATATLLIESDEANVVSIEEVYGIDSSQGEYYQTQFEILNSRKLAERVIHDLKISSHAEYASKEGRGFSLKSLIPFLPPANPWTDGQKSQSVLSQFRKNTAIEPLRGTQLVNITFESTDAELAPKVANAIGNAYIDSHLEARLELTQKAASWLTERLGGMRGQLEAAETSLQSYQESQNLVDISGVQTLTAKELDELTRRLSEARKQATAAKSQFDAVGGSSSHYQGSWESLPGVLSDRLAQRLKEEQSSVESSFIELKKRYGPKHPKFIAADSKADSARNSFQRRVQQIVEGFQEQYEQAMADQRQVEKAIESSKLEIQDINRKNYELSQLQRAVKTNQQLYDMFFQRFQETNQTDFAAANARFVDLAERPYVPFKPRKLLIVALAAFLSLVVGVLLALLRAALDNTIRVAEDIEDKLGQSVLGVIPFEGKLDSNVFASRLYLQKGHESFSEAIRSLRTSFVLAGLDKPHQITVVTSSVPGEGKTTISSNLALALGQMERVLLIDADMRRPSLATEFGLAKGTEGLAELVAGTVRLEECTHHLDELSIDLITAGAVPPNPLDLLSSRRFDTLMVELRKKYDRIIIDSAPTQAVSDSLVLSTKADALIYVVKSDSVATNAIANGLQRLMNVGAPIIGVTLNQFDARVAARYGYHGSGSYGYYGYGYASKAYS